jgi:hypothetical protein
MLTNEEIEIVSATPQDVSVIQTTARTTWAATGRTLSERGCASTRSYGYTFSTFTRWEEKSKEQHVSDVVKLLDEWHS